MDRKAAALQSPTGADPRFDVVWRDDRDRMLGLARRMLGDATEAEDVVQDASAASRAWTSTSSKTYKAGRGGRASAVPRPYPLRPLPPRVHHPQLVARRGHLAPTGTRRRPRRSGHARRPSPARPRGRARPTLPRRTHRVRPPRHLRVPLRGSRRDRRTLDRRLPSTREPGTACHPRGLRPETRRRQPGRHRGRAAPRRLGTIHRGLLRR